MTMLARGQRLARSFSFAVERTGLRAMAGGRAAKRG
jgi:aldose 1-epimerase